MEEKITIATSEKNNQAVITWHSKYGSTVVWTVTAERSELQVHGEWFTGDSASEDTIKLAPIDANTVMVYI